MKTIDHIFILKLTYFADFVNEINKLNLSLEVNMAKILTARYKVAYVLSQFKLQARKMEIRPHGLIYIQRCSFGEGITINLLSATKSIRGYISRSHTTRIHRLCKYLYWKQN